MLGLFLKEFLKIVSVCLCVCVKHISEDNFQELVPYFLYHVAFRDSTQVGKFSPHHLALP